MTSRTSSEDWSAEPRVHVRRDAVSAREGRPPTLGEVIGATAREENEEAAQGSVERVSCPSCRAEYGMPADLMPPWGGRVRCPRCASAFSVGARAEADDLISSIISKSPARWQSACQRQALWAEWGEPLLEAYAMLRERHGAQSASRALRRALENVAPGVAWLAPPPAVPVYGEDEAREETMFDRRREC
ncbi:MAG TPA: zinc-ribbon domain-containing protein [Candidatus Eisenbacteria bacterium]|nr:zinc-ribbon domain-containing protein [Candidatus Eisenbacteria bacterium]